jgi:Leucine-rich repeat (LRR) protein
MEKKWENSFINTNIVDEAVLETLTLIIEAVEHTQFRQFRVSYDNLSRDDNVDFSNFAKLNDEYEKLLQTVDVDENLEDIEYLEPSHENFVASNNFTLSNKLVEDGQAGKYWDDTCRDGDLDYQDECRNTKVWLGDEINSLRKRAANRAKYAEMVRRDNCIIKVQSLFRGFSSRKKLRIVHKALLIVCRTILAFTFRRRYNAKRTTEIKLNSLLSSLLLSLVDSVVSSTYEDCLSTSLIQNRDESTSLFETSSHQLFAIPEFTMKSNSAISSQSYEFIRDYAYYRCRITSSKVLLLGSSCVRRKKPNIRVSSAVNYLANETVPQKRSSSLRSRFSFIDVSATNSDNLSTTIRQASEAISGNPEALTRSFTDVSVESLSDEFFVENAGICGNAVVANVNKVSSLNCVSSISNLRTLSFCDNLISICDELQHMSSLRHVNIDSNKIFGHLNLLSPQLLSLSLNCNNIESFRAVDALCLERLSLYSNSLVRFEIVGEFSLSNLTYLNLGRNRLSEINWENMSKLVLLSTLILSQNDLKQFPYALSLPLLQSLWLNGNKISGYLKQPAAMNSTSKLPMLKRLYLQDNKITFLDRSFGRHLPNLLELDLSFNEISSPSIVQHLCQFCQLRNLRLSDNPVMSMRFVADQVNEFIQMIVTRKITSKGTILDDPKNHFVYHFSYCLRNALDMALIRRKKLLSGLRNKGLNLADIEITYFNEGVYRDCPRFLSSKVEQSNGLCLFATARLAVFVSSVSNANLMFLKAQDTSILPPQSEYINEIVGVVELKYLHNFHHSEQLQPQEQVRNESSIQQTDELDQALELRQHDRSLQEQGLLHPPEQQRYYDNHLNLQSSDVCVYENNAAKALQKFFGKIRRRKFTKSVIEKVRHKDQEIDDLLTEDIALDWLDDMNADSEIFGKNEIESSLAPLAYGDHVRKRNLQLDIQEVHRASFDEVSILTSKSAPSQNNAPAKTSKAVEIRDEWGIQNEIFLSTMLKRQKKIR